MRVIVKIGTSSLTHENGELNDVIIDKLCNEIGDLQKDDHEIVLVTSGAIAAGLPSLGFSKSRPKDTATLQAAAAVGQIRLMHAYDDAFRSRGVVSAQVLFSPHNFFARNEYLHARATLERLLELRIVPVANENDAIADDEIRFGDNDRIAALIAQAVHADLLVLLTDTAGLFTADPRYDPNASLVEEITELSRELERAAGQAGTTRGSGGMASKLAAARMSSWAGVRAVIASAARERVLLDAIEGVAGVGTQYYARRRTLSARKIWIAFAMPSVGRIVVDDGAAIALRRTNCSLLPAGVIQVDGRFDAGDGVDICDQNGLQVAKGVTRYSSMGLISHMGRRSADLPDTFSVEVIHRDDLVLVSTE